jgi:hypothetical protein
MATTHTDLVRRFEEAEEASRAGRADAEQCRDYKDGRQLTDTEKAALKKRKQPIVIENLIRPKVDYLCGLERQSRTDPKAYPRTAAHEDDANAATDALIYVTEDQDFAIKRSTVFDHMLVEGTGAVEVTAAQVKGGIDPKITCIAWDRLFIDPHSVALDCYDAAYIGFITWMDLDAAKRRWEGKDAELDASFNSGTETFDDKPRTTWTDTKRRRVRIVTIYDRSDGVWQRGVFTKGGELEPLVDSPFLDDEGKPDCAIIAQSAFIDRDNDRYGPVRDWITLQDEVNKRRSKFLHLSNSNRVRVSLGHNPEQVRKEMMRPDGVIVADAGEIEELGNGNMAAGHFALLAEAKQAIQATGPNATMQGKAGQDQSGRAILALQQGGMTEMAPLLDSLRHFNIRVYRAIWCRIKQFWTAERWVRVTDDEKNARFVGFNVTKGQQAMQKLEVALKEGKIDQQTAMQYAMQIQQDPAMAQKVNVLAELDVDIHLEEVVDAPTLQAEQYDKLANTIPAIGQLMESQSPMAKVLLKLLVQASQLRGKDKLLEILEPKEGEQGADPAQAAQEAIQAQMAMAQQQAEMEGQITLQKAHIEAQTDVEVAKIKAATDLAIKREAAAADAQLAEAKAQQDARIAAAQLQSAAQLAEQKALLDYEVKSRVADMTGETQRVKEADDRDGARSDAQTAIMSQLAEVVAQLARPKNKIPIRDEQGLIVGIREEAA